MPFTLEIVTPERLAWKGEASALVLPTIDGEVGILPKHEPYVTVLGAGEGRITALDGSIEYIAIIGGFVQVRPDRVVVLAESADLVAVSAVAASTRPPLPPRRNENAAKNAMMAATGRNRTRMALLARLTRARALSSEMSRTSAISSYSSSAT